MPAASAVEAHLALFDAQREAALAALDGLPEPLLWQRPAPGEWSLGEILDHNYLLIASTMPYVRFAWRAFGWVGRLGRGRAYATDIPDRYRDGKFPMWVGFLWTPRYNARRPRPLAELASELRQLHRTVRSFYAGKDEAVLGNVYLFDPYFGWLNLITTLRLGIHHDQLHYDDVIRQAAAFRAALQ